MYIYNKLFSYEVLHFLPENVMTLYQRILFVSNLLKFYSQAEPITKELLLVGRVHCYFKTKLNSNINLPKPASYYR